MLLQQYLSNQLSTEAQTSALEQLVSAHPYFTPAQFQLLAAKKEGDAGYTELAAKNSVLFRDPLWLNFKLLQLNKKESPVEETVIIPNPGVEPEPFVPEEDPAEEPIVEPEPIVPGEDPVEEPVIDPLPEPVVEDSAATTDLAAQETESITIPAEAATIEAKAEPALLKDILNQSNTGLPDELPVFQPLYTSDYFASQGIKLGEQVAPGDKLGKQLKSFTEWLKGMKKLHPEKLAQQLNSNTDTAVPDQAEKSNTEGDVLTEAMAEVFTLQGKAEKAAEIYRKLSLLNPAKSAYFAAKIEQLKRT